MRVILKREAPTSLLSITIRVIWPNTWALVPRRLEFKSRLCHRDCCVTLGQRNLSGPQAYKMGFTDKRSMWCTHPSYKAFEGMCDLQQRKDFDRWQLFSCAHSPAGPMATDSSGV